MKYLAIAALLLATSCKTRNHYQLKLIYVVNKDNGSATVDRKQRIAAANDSLAYVQAVNIYNQRIEENNKTHEQCDHFELYDPKGNRVKTVVK